MNRNPGATEPCENHPAALIVSSLRPPRLLRLLRLGVGCVGVDSVGVDGVSIGVGLTMGSETIADGRDPSRGWVGVSSPEGAIQLLISSSFSSRSSRLGALLLSASMSVGVGGVGVVG